MAQLMPLSLTVSCFSKIQIGFTFLAPAHLGSPGQRAIKRGCVCTVQSDQNLGGLYFVQQLSIDIWCPGPTSAANLLAAAAAVKRRDRQTDGRTLST